MCDSPKTLRNHLTGSENNGYFSSLNFSEFFKTLPPTTPIQEDNQKRGLSLLVGFLFLIKKFQLKKL